MSEQTQRTKKIWLLRGLPGSGKSTWAREQVKQFPNMYKRINKDDLRSMVDDGKWSGDNERFILRLRNMMIREALGAGYDVIVDDTNFAPKHKETMDILAYEFPGTQVVEKFFDTPLQECIERDAKRSNPVGAGVIRKMWADFLKPAPYQDLPNLPTCIICDIDGTIAERGDRGQYEEEKVGVDHPIEKVIDILKTYKAAKPINIILFSGRHITCKRETEIWLLNNGVPYDALYMRPADNNDKDYNIKKQLFEDNIRNKYNVLFVLDDRNQVVNLWRSLGLKCLQVDFGDF